MLLLPCTDTFKDRNIFPFLYISFTKIGHFIFQAGYEQLINRLHAAIPKMTSDGTRLQMIVCSATLHAFEVKKMAERLMHFPTWVDLKVKNLSKLA